MSNIYYERKELGQVIGVYTTEDMAWRAADTEFCAVINLAHGQTELASGYTITKVT